MKATGDKIRCLSVVVCTFNRAESLRFTVSRALTCTLPKQCDVEIIVVDNNSGDNTRHVIEELVSDTPIRVIYVLEPQKGVGYACNVGIAHARGDVVCFIDDDVILDRQFFVLVKKEFETRCFNGIIGGRVELWDPTDLPLTIKTDLDEQRLTLDRVPAGFIHGCNMSAHRNVLEAIGGFDRRLGPGSIGGSCADLDFFYRARRHGFEVIYCPKISVYHNHGRKTSEQLNAVMTLYQIGRGAFYAKHLLAGDGRILRFAYWEYCKGLRAIVAAPCDFAKAKAEFHVLRNYNRGAIRFICARHSAGADPQHVCLGAPVTLASNGTNSHRR